MPERVTIQKLIEGGVIKPGVRLEKKYLGKLMAAQIRADGSITFAGRIYGTPSMAAGAARAAALGLKGILAANGWDFWNVKSPDGPPISLSLIRDRFAKVSGIRAKRRSPHLR